MAYSSTLKNQIDEPTWEQMRFFPAATPNLSSLKTSKIAGDRYFYAYSAQAFYRYDTYKDTWIQVSSIPTAPLTVAGMEYVSKGNYYGKNIRSVNSSQMLIAGFPGNRGVGKVIQIVSGTGPGQARVITSTGEPIVYDQGVATSVTGALILTDNLKKWDINQWSGYNCRILFGTGTSQFRKILYNDATNLYFGDINWQQLFPAGDGGWSSQAPFALPVATAGSQSHYTLEAQTITVNSPWSPTPDDSSIFAIQGGVMALMSSAATTPFYTMQAYDVLSDVWTNRTATSGPILSAALGTDLSVLNTASSSATPLVTGQATSGTSRTLTDTAKTWVVDQWINYRVTIIGGTGSGMTKRIVGNLAHSFEVAAAWEVNPDNTSIYMIDPDLDSFYASGMGLSSVLTYSIFADLCSQGSIYSYGTARNMGVKGAGFEAFAVTTGARATNGIWAINPVPTAGGTAYSVGDVLTITTGGTSGQVAVTSISLNGVVTGLSLRSSGTGYGVSAGQVTTGGTGANCTVEVLAVGTVGLITTAINHSLKTGDTVQFSGDALWVAGGTYGLGYYGIICVPSLTTCYIMLTAAGNATAAATQSVTTLVDSSANWVVNEHAGKIAMIAAPGSTGAAVTRRIVSNTSSVLTLQSAIGAPTNGTSRYLIHDVRCYGRALQYRTPSLSDSGYATGGTSATLVDSTKNWIGNQWAGYKMRIYAGTGFDHNDVTIISNTATTLNLSSPGFTPDTTTKYNIMTTYGLLTAVGNVTNAVLTDTTKNWAVNMWAGKRVRINSGTGQGVEMSITSNTATALTLVGVYTTPPLANESTYCILDIPQRGTGSRIVWLEKLTSAPGRYIASLRGGASNTGDIYDITTELWALSYDLLPQGETYTTGSMMCYDGANAFYIHKDATGRIYKFNLLTGDIEGAGTMPYGQGVATLGERMDIITTVDGLKYLYIMRHTGAATGTEMYRMLIW